MGMRSRRLGHSDRIPSSKQRASVRGSTRFTGVAASVRRVVFDDLGGDFDLTSHGVDGDESAFVCPPLRHAQLRRDGRPLVASALSVCSGE
jgi:hypothetical protein